MATVNKDFRIKAGLVVEGANATVNGQNIITTGSSTDNLQEGTTNLYFTEARAAAAVADEISTAVSTAINALTTTDIEEGVNLYFTNQRALSATAAAYDATGAAAAAQTAAEGYADTVATNAYNNAVVAAANDATTKMQQAESYADQSALDAQNNAKAYADSLAINYDASGAAASAQLAAETYADGVAATAEQNAKSYGETYTNNAINGLSGSGTASVAGHIDILVGTGINVNTGNNSIEIARQTVDTWYDASGSADNALAAANTYTDGKVADLVGGAPALLDTLNELSAAIANNPNYATDVANLVAGKQNTLTAGNGVAIDTNDTISANVDGLTIVNNGGTSNNLLSVPLGNGLTAGSLGIEVNTSTIASVNYVDTNFVNVADLPGQLGDYVPLTQKGVANGVATLDANGFVPASQLDINVTGDIATAINALTTSDIEEGTNLYFTDARAVDAIATETIYPPAVVINNLSKQVATTQTVTAISTVNGLTWAKSEYKSAKLTVKAKTASHTQLSEILVTLDGSDNVAITEYGIVYTDAELAVVSADVSGSDVRIRVTTVNPSTDVTVVGTLLV